MARWTVEEPAQIAAFLAAKLPQMKRSTLKARLKHGAVQVNGETARRHDTPLAPGDVVELSAEGAPGKKASGKEPAILHVDEQLVVVDKPSGLLTVSAKKRGDEPTALTLTGPRLKGSPRLFPCHRLDRETSGVLLLPRDKQTQEHFFAHWSDVEKTYVALVEGVVEDDEGTVDAPLFEHPRSLAVSVSHGPDARSATSHYRVLERGEGRSLVEVRLQTGRKHQIRVHMQHLGHTVVGDARYGSGKKGAPRLCLHAFRLAFTHPRTGERLVFESPTPKLFTKLLRA
jgi:23S rRNA pseudouridine1911/1915/1917 synthase